MPNGAGDTSTTTGLRVGVLALQGAFEAHQERLIEIGVDAPLIRTPLDLETVDAVVLPGGESTTMSRLLTTSGLFDALEDRFAEGMPVFGTCAGMILCAADVLDGRSDQRGFDLIDLTVRRNGYGRQLESFESDINVAGLDEPFHAVFIRAPFVERIGDDVEILASLDGVAVLVRNQRCTVAAFHPELTNDVRLHEIFVSSLKTSH
ncbi:MAG: pyridoxal 5'-phosphate synthase glutaminase subunit PdxT [Actinobacteria bacterium]|nr:pyridoxal 5'-phosphate synthase glutaminase subunit PdxT [Actinomycetota bacterium]